MVIEPLPQSVAEDGAKRPNGLEPTATYAVYSAHGYLLGRFDNVDRALASLEHWAQAVYVVHRQFVIARRPLRWQLDLG